MEYIAKVTLYHNTKGLIKEGQTVELTKEEVAEYDKDYFKDLFETDATDETDTDETDTDETGEDKPKKRGKKSEKPAE